LEEANESAEQISVTCSSWYDPYIHCLTREQVYVLFSDAEDDAATAYGLSSNGGDPSRHSHNLGSERDYLSDKRLARSAAALDKGSIV
jgi:hypothetical protein